MRCTTQSVEFEEAIDLLFTYDSVTPAALTPTAPLPAGCNPDGLGTQEATASARGRACLPTPSPIPQRDVPCAQEPLEHQAPTPKTVDMVRPPGGCEAQTALQRSLQACSTSMGAASGGARVPASERSGSPAGSRDPECPKYAECEPQNEAIPAPPPKAAYTSMGSASGGATTSLSPGTDTLHVPPSLNPAPCTTREPSVGMEATRQWIRTRLSYLLRTPASDLPDRDIPLRRRVLEYRREGGSWVTLGGGGALFYWSDIWA